MFIMSTSIYVIQYFKRLEQFDLDIDKVPTTDRRHRSCALQARSSPQSAGLTHQVACGLVLPTAADLFMASALMAEITPTTIVYPTTIHGSPLLACSR